MQSRKLTASWILGMAALVCAHAAVHAQGLSPMQKTGSTPSDRKLFRLSIINPYPKEMRYELSAEDVHTQHMQSDVKFTGRTGSLPPQSQRKILVVIPVPEGRRDIRICLRFPELQGTVRPRVCGDYSAVALRSPERQRGVPAASTAGRGG